MKATPVQGEGEVPTQISNRSQCLGGIHPAGVQGGIEGSRRSHKDSQHHGTSRQDWAPHQVRVPLG